MTERRWPAEWEAQDAVQLTWPHADMEWGGNLPAVVDLYEQLVARLVTAGAVVIAAPPASVDGLRRRFADLRLPTARIRCYPAASNDVWARDHGPITVLGQDGPRLLDFCFNGWGGKYPAEHDNAITARLHQLGAYPGAELESVSLVLEGGAIESDGRGTLLTTERCLLNRNRNPRLDRSAVEAALGAALGLRHVNWLRHGALEGDDTDSHVDTLARLCPDNIILYQDCDDSADSHYAELSAMAEELRGLRDADGRPYRLLPLPWPMAQHDPDDGHRLPATYANFLVFNDLVLVPTYDDPRDAEALKQVSRAFPGRRIQGLDCRPLIRQHGSLHCITMQLPRGVLAAGQPSGGSEQP
ncbi:agmatine deiminase family protein [Parahaliea mediterranea]|nr:agmatine deiminase family protein [Parahaliea mediterranea]